MKIKNSCKKGEFFIYDRKLLNGLYQYIKKYVTYFILI